MPNGIGNWKIQQYSPRLQNGQKLPNKNIEYESRRDQTPQIPRYAEEANNQTIL